MSTKNRKFYYQIQQFHEDGLIDIFVGLALIFGSVLIRNELVWMVGIYIPVVYPTWKATRKCIHQGRTDTIFVESNQQVKRSAIMPHIALLFGSLVLVGVGTFTFLALISKPISTLLRNNFLLFFGIVSAGIWVYIATFLKQSRFYIYAILSLVSLAASQISIIPFWEALALNGIIISGIGILTSIRFVRINQTFSS
jgi:hypothetical protein